MQIYLRTAGLRSQKNLEKKLLLIMKRKFLQTLFSSSKTFTAQNFVHQVAPFLLI